MEESVQVRIPQGMLTGLSEHGVSRFSAIPFAQAPCGALRFRPPQPAQWQGVRDATRPGPVCPQLPSRLRGAMGDFQAEHSEDCLHLTVWTPAADTRRRPVVIWLHGGAWQSGGGALDWYNGAHLARRGDIVVVAPNYRLAALGWLYVPGETANVGLLDQEAAIAWVREHIEHFGGDPERITVMGQSAGASSMAAMLARQPLFSRAIFQSAALGRGFRSAAQANDLGQAFLQAAGVETLDQARQLPVEALLKAQQAPEVGKVLQDEGSQRSLFCPVLDGDVLPEDIEPALVFAAGRADVLIGYTRNEMAAFPGHSVDEESTRLGDRVFGALSRRWAADAQAAGRQAWEFRFDVGPNPVFGACHCIELPFMFDSLDAFTGAPMLEGLRPELGARLVDQMQRAWIAFIRGDGPPWSPAPHQHAFS